MFEMSMVEEQSIYIPTAHALEAIADSIVGGKESVEKKKLSSFVLAPERA